MEYKWDFKNSDYPRQFEYLICEFLNSVYKDYRWETNKQTRDGNRDIEGRHINNNSRAWAEVKFKNTSSKKATSLTSTRYDSTLVSASISSEDDIVDFKFVTNSHFNEYFILRIETFFMNKEVGIKYITEAQLLYWLSVNDGIRKKYLKTKVDFSAVYPDKETWKILSIIITKKVEGENKKEKRTDFNNLDSVCDSTLYIKLEIRNSIPKDADLIIVNNNTNIHNENFRSEVGINDFKIKLAPGIPTDGKLQIKFMTENDLKVEREIEISNKKLILLENQNTALQEIETKIQAEISFFNLIGHQKVGKSFLLEHFISEKEKTDQVHTLYLTGIVNDDIIQLYELVKNYYKLEDYQLENLESALMNYAILDIQYFLENHVEELELKQEHLENPSYIVVYDLGKGSELITKLILRYIEKIFEVDKTVIVIESHEAISLKTRVDVVELKAISNKDAELFLMNTSAQRDGEKISEVLKYLEEKKVFPSFRNLLQISSLINESLGALEKFKEGLEVILSPSMDQLEEKEKEMLYVIQNSKQHIPFLHILEKEFSAIPSLLDKKIISVRESAIVSNYSLKIEKEQIDLMEIQSIFERIYKETKNSQYLLDMLLIDNRLLEEKFELLNEQGRYFQNRTEYFSSLPYFEMCDKLNVGSITPKQKIENLFYYGECLNHCISINEAIKTFSYAYVLSGEYGIDHLKALVYSELITMSFASFINPNILLANTKNFLEGTKEFNWEEYWEKNHLKNNDTEKAKFYKAKETAMNRLIVLSLSCDKFEDGLCYLDKNIKLIDNDSNHIGHHHHKGFCYMDYAKGIYHKDIMEAKTYLDKALIIFQECENEKRRTIDCKCEIAYIECLISNTNENLDKLFEVSNKLKAEGFLAVYYRSLLKITAIYLSQKKTNEASELLETFKSAEQMNNTRSKFIITHLESIIYYLDGNAVEYEKRVKEMNVAKGFSATYDFLLTIQPMEKKNITFYSADSSSAANTIYFDPRMW